MKKTQFKDATRNIKKRLVSFLSIVLVSMLGLAALFTTHYMAEGLEKGANEYFTGHDFKDFEMISSTGVSEANLKKIASTEGVADAEGVISSDGSLSDGDTKLKVTVVSITERVSVPELVEGKKPIGRDECMVSEDTAELHGVKVGDKVRLSLTGLDTLGDESPLYSKEFTVTGLMKHPDYFRRKATNVVALPLTAFNEKATNGLFTRVFIKADAPEGVSIFADEYFDKLSGTDERLEALVKVLEEDRTKEMKDEAYAEIDAQWAEAEAELAKGEQDIKDGEAELNKKLEDGRAKLDEAQKTLDAAVKKGEKKISDGEKALAQAEKLIADGEKKLAEGKKAYAAGKAELDQKKAELEAGKKQLADAEAAYAQAKAEFDKLAWTEGLLTDIEVILQAIESQSHNWPPEVMHAEWDIAKAISEHKDTIIRIVDLTKDDNFRNMIKSIDDWLGTNIMKTVDEIRALEGVINSIIAESENIINSGDRDYHAHYTKPVLEAVKSLLQKIKDGRAALEAAAAKIEEGRQKIAEGERLIAEGEKKLAAGAKEIEDGEKQLAEAKKKYADGKAELAAGKKKLKKEKAEAEKKIKAGWAEYYSQKARYESKLAEAKELLKTNREEAEKKLAEAKAEVEKMSSKWILLDKKANSGYVDINSNLNSIRTAGLIMGILFLVITAIVCFSTLVIIIDEQKEMVGTTKAFGFLKSEVLGKYLMFGGLAAVLGCLLGVLLSLFGSNAVQKIYLDSGIYQMENPGAIVVPGLTIISCLVIIAVNVIATIVSCTDILRSPASLLMKGEVLKKEKKGKKKKEVKSKGGSLYSRLIIRNMVDDKARVIVTICIIAFSTFLMGTGFSIKYGYDGMMDRQQNEINKYDIKVTMNDDVTDEQKAQLATLIKDKGASYLSASTQSRLYDWDNRIDGLVFICADTDEIGDYIAVTDPKTKEELTIPESGVLIQKRMHESYGMNEGDTLPVRDSTLNEHEAKIAGYFTNYVGRTVIASPSAYKEIFGTDFKPNTYYVKLGGADEKGLKDAMLDITSELSFEANNDFIGKFEAVAFIFNIVVIIIVGIAVLMSFLILTNLANIYMTRKKTELTVMRVNGFTVKETKGYLTKETIITTSVGIVLGVLIGAIATPLIIKTLQQPDLEFVRSFHVVAWAISVGLETLFAIIIYNTVFNKVKKLNLKDIT